MTTCADKFIPRLKAAQDQTDKPQPDCMRTPLLSEEAIGDIVAVSGAMRVIEKLLEVRTENIRMMEEMDAYDMGDLFGVLRNVLDGALEKRVVCGRNAQKEAGQ